MVEINGYGRCWRPAGFRWNGVLIVTDTGLDGCGWYLASDERGLGCYITHVVMIR